MENRSTINFKLENTRVIFEAKIAKKDEDTPHTVLNRSTLEDMERALNVWLECGNYKILSVEKVERERVSLS
jgi:hypothetical protein